MPYEKFQFIAYTIVCVDVIISTVEVGASSVGIHFTDTREDVTLELEEVYPLGWYICIVIYNMFYDLRTCIFIHVYTQYKLLC